MRESATGTSDAYRTELEFHDRMTSPFVVALREALVRLEAASPADPGEAIVARRLLREVRETASRLEGGPDDTDLVSIICHDLKDPLASIVMGAGFLRKTVPVGDASVRRVVDAIARSSDRMGQVITDFHDLARLEAGRVSLDAKPADVRPILEEAATAFAVKATERQIEFTVEVTGENLSATCDRARLLKIVSKLLANAVKFTPPGGRVVLRGERAGAGVRITVTDTGKGIDTERLPTIFDRAANARRTPRDGPGLGLAIAQGLVELHGGTIEVHSREGEGSTFAFTIGLPFNYPAPA